LAWPSAPAALRPGEASQRLTPPHPPLAGARQKSCIKSPGDGG